jgi:hypothetical protein
MDCLMAAGLVGLAVRVEAWVAGRGLRLLLVQVTFLGMDNQVQSIHYTIKSWVLGFS